MSKFRLLIVEDNERDLSVCRDTVARYKAEKNREVELVECKNIEEFRLKHDNSIDGAIIDLRLGNKGDEGNSVIREIDELHFRIPVAVLTGTPDAADADFTYIGVFKKGEQGSGYDELLDRFWLIHDTGLTRIMGGRGIIEDTLSKVFRLNLMPQHKKWTEYGRIDSSRTEKALLRHTLNHLLQLLDDDARCFPEEMYLSPPLTDMIHTGSIVKHNECRQQFVVMSPACDLVIRGGSFKTERILLVEIDPLVKVTEIATKHCTDDTDKEQKLRTVLGNNYSAYHHWLPETDFFEGGFINFRKVSSIKKTDFDRQYGKPTLQISPSFIKDVISRFSNYYSRQGQPDIDCDRFITHLTAIQETAR